MERTYYCNDDLSYYTSYTVYVHSHKLHVTYEPIHLVQFDNRDQALDAWLTCEKWLTKTDSELHAA